MATVEEVLGEAEVKRRVTNYKRNRTRQIRQRVKPDMVKCVGGPFTGKEIAMHLSCTADICVGDFRGHYRRIEKDHPSVWRGDGNWFTNTAHWVAI